ncbi:MAG: hypothetical protein MZV49_12170 [Rhodopseudomonas palustris]|nr:hypothetical protein [Rhodopseudomonas palustris]
MTTSDRAAVLEFFKDYEQVTEVLQRLSEKVTAAGVDVPGVTVTKETRAA